MSQGERRVAIDAPAKLNLGLEVLGRRDDGYHELATIFLAVDLYDQLIVTQLSEDPHPQPLSQCDLTGEASSLAAAPNRPAAATPPHHRPPSPVAMGEGLGMRANAGDPDAPTPPLPPPASHSLGRGELATEPGLKQEQCFSGEVSFGTRAAGPDFAEEPNLALLALRVLGAELRLRGGARISLKKRIPVAAGLGGASSDAAAALLAGRELWGLEIGDERRREIAARLGSDMPFFLQGGCALGRGRGEQLTALPVPRDVWFVLVAPDVMVPRKTATLFANLEMSDFSDGSRIAAQAARLRDGLPLDTALLANTFARALYRVVPELASLPGVMREAGAETVAITGAGPAHYAVVDDGEAAERIAARLRQRLGDWARVMVVRPV